MANRKRLVGESYSTYKASLKEQERKDRRFIGYVRVAGKLVKIHKPERRSFDAIR